LTAAVSWSIVSSTKGWTEPAQSPARSAHDINFLHCLQN